MNEPAACGPRAAGGRPASKFVHSRRFRDGQVSCRMVPCLERVASVVPTRQDDGDEAARGGPPGAGAFIHPPRSPWHPHNGTVVAYRSARSWQDTPFGVARPAPERGGTELSPPIDSSSKPAMIATGPGIGHRRRSAGCLVAGIRLPDLTVPPGQGASDRSSG